MRLGLGVATAWNWDEEREWVHTADVISLQPGRINTPYRVGYHAAGSAYGIALGTTALPGTRLGTRIVGIVLGVATVAVAAAMAGALAGPAAATWTAALVAFNEYHASVSAMAQEKVYYLFFGVLAVYAFWRFLETDRDRWLYATAASLGMAYFCKELAALLGPVFLLALIRRDRLAWLWRGRSWIAAGIVVLFVIPDYLGGAEAATTAISPGDHLSRLQGLGLRYHPTVFYLYDLVQWAFTRLGRDFVDPGLYPYTNLVSGLVLLGGVAWGLGVGRVWRSHLGLLLCATFVMIFVWFSVVETNSGNRLLDPIGWQWVDLTFVPAAALAGAWLATQSGLWRTVTWTIAGLGLTIAVADAMTTRLQQSPLAPAACPEHVLATGAMQEVRIELGSCDACATPEARIESVSVTGPGGALRPAADDEFDVVAEGAVPRLRLRAHSRPGESWGGWPGPWADDEPARRYVISLRTTTPGAPAWQQATEPDTVDVDVFIMPRPYEPHYLPVFACRSDAD